jgi:hypothetical protein
MEVNNKVLGALLIAATVGLVTDHILVRGNLNTEIERSMIKDNHQEKALIKMEKLFDRVTTLEAREGIYHNHYTED